MTVDRYLKDVKMISLAEENEQEKEEENCIFHNKSYLLN